MSGGPNPNGFLGLFATMNSKKEVIPTSTTPKYLGTLDLDDLSKFQMFQQKTNGDPQELKNFLAKVNSNKGFSKRMSRDHTATEAPKRKVHKRAKKGLTKPMTEDEKNIEALQVLVTSNIQNSLAERRRQYLAQKSAPLPPHGNIHTQEQVEKPPQYNSPPSGLPFLVQDTPAVPRTQSGLPFLAPPSNQAHRTFQAQQAPALSNFIFNPQSSQAMNQGQNFVLLQNMNTPPPVLYGPTLPPSYSFTAADKVDLGSQNQPNMFQTNPQIGSGRSKDPGLVRVSMADISRQLKMNRMKEEQAMLQKQINQLESKPLQNSYNQPQSSFNIGNLQSSVYGSGKVANSNFVTPSLNIGQPQGSFVTPRTTFEQAHNNYLHSSPLQNTFKPQHSEMIKPQLSFGQTEYNSPRSGVDTNQAFSQNSRISYPRAMNFGLPMNFEDMMNTGLKLAKQSRKYHHEVVQAAPPTPVTVSPQAWRSGQNDHETYINRQPVKSSPNFSPSKPHPSRTSRNKERELKGQSINVINSDQIHIIGPNCYVMTKSGFKLMGKAPKCQPERPGGPPQGGSPATSSIWDSLTSIPIVDRFAKTLGMRH